MSDDRFCIQTPVARKDEAELKTLVEAIIASLTQEVVFEPNSAGDSVATQETLKELAAALVAGEARANQLCGICLHDKAGAAR